MNSNYTNLKSKLEWIPHVRAKARSNHCAMFEKTDTQHRRLHSGSQTLSFHFRDHKIPGKSPP